MAKKKPKMTREFDILSTTRHADGTVTTTGRWIDVTRTNVEVTLVTGTKVTAQEAAVVDRSKVMTYTVAPAKQTTESTKVKVEQQEKPGPLVVLSTL